MAVNAVSPFIGGRCYATRVARCAEARARPRHLTVLRRVFKRRSRGIDGTARVSLGVLPYVPPNQRPLGRVAAGVPAAAEPAL